MRSPVYKQRHDCEGGVARAQRRCLSPAVPVALPADRRDMREVQRSTAEAPLCPGDVTQCGPPDLFKETAKSSASV